MNSNLECMGKYCKEIAIVEREYRGFEPLLPNIRVRLCVLHMKQWPWDDLQDLLKETKLETKIDS